MPSTLLSIVGFISFGIGVLWLAYGFAGPMGKQILNIIVPVGPSVSLPPTLICPAAFLLVGIVLIIIGRR